MRRGDKTGLAALVIVLLALVVNLAWIAFVIWAIYTVVQWLITK